MRLYSFRFGCVLAFACFVSITWIKSIPSDGGSTMQTLDQRLLLAEGLAGQVRRDLSSLLEELRNTSKAANISYPISTTTTTNSSIPTETIRQKVGHSGQQTFLQPNIYLYMPHLRQHPDSLLPNVVLGQGRRGVSLVLGIPTVKREKQSYLVSTLRSLLYGLTTLQQQDLLIIVFVAETDSDYVGSIAESIRKKWRTKQNLDFSFLMLYAQDKGTYYVQLEDDVVAKAGYFNTMKTYANQRSQKWLYLEFSQLGFIGKMFQSRDLPMIAEFFLMFHRDKPIDWLLDHILWVKVCNPEKDAKDCDKQKAQLRYRYKPSLFQHVGLHSSLPGKLQQLKDKDFGQQSLFQAHNNPDAELSSSLKHYQAHSLERAYRGQDFFWALTPSQGDYVLFNFTQPIHISRYLFRSGNIETSGDKFTNTTVEVLPKNASARDRLVIGSSSSYKGSDKPFITIGAFENGVAEGEIEEVLQPISALRLLVHSDADVWALLSEILIAV
ncbi:alpha-1,3-mannosyl-glycoprotein 4-beta-N-acetylglucosaminyltransferase B isoform X2 [Etheostoma spectabile]|uniref:alpha-1,3-mannosyl-glycoprotein 4-beta-N-acetylglucosaminyltransferase B isoform X2 n=1 Tax=Etheostoma spectabile TaxID=54343 RepID=UPI0013AEB9D3|nr:alpha-1,3-mannosyl-glycoprotein 4-beta-N-acetylglucosaminyltransferase B-like isoform X2 [Etheostoma spectabile]